MMDTITKVAPFAWLAIIGLAVVVAAVRHWREHSREEYGG